MTKMPSQKLERHCVFCGKPPTDRSREHVLPQWLLKLTGDPKRPAILGPGKRKGPSIRVFAFDQFTFPACKECNESYSHLEGSARLVVGKLLSRSAIAEGECVTLLDWLDKVRIGIWLGNRYLSENIAEITPNFHISDRIGQADRMAWISQANLSDGLNVMGTHTPLFAYMPSAFGLRINDILILSASENFIVSEGLGFPFAKKTWTTIGEKRLLHDMQPGTKRISNPIFPTPSKVASLKIYQAIYSRVAKYDEGEWSSRYVRNNSLDWDSGQGRVFVDGWNGIKPGGIDEIDHLRSVGFNTDNQHLIFGADVLDVQNALLRKGPSLHQLPPEVRKAAAFRQRWLFARNLLLKDAYLDGRVINSNADLERAAAGEFRVFPT